MGRRGTGASAACEHSDITLTPRRSTRRPPKRPLHFENRVIIESRNILGFSPRHSIGTYAPGSGDANLWARFNALAAIVDFAVSGLIITSIAHRFFHSLLSTPIPD